MGKTKVFDSEPKVAGIYMIRIKATNKIYIGESANIYNRWKRYVWAAESDKDYYETQRKIVQDIRHYGVNKCEFVVLECGAKYEDKDFRIEREKELIAEYGARNECIGYNSTRGGETGPSAPRKQGSAERLKRAKPIILYDTETGRATLFFGGAKSIGDKFGYGKDVMSHTVKRGSLFLNRYYLVPLSKSEQNDILEKLRKKKLGNVEQSQKARSHSANAFYKYENAVKRVNEIFDD